MALAKRATLPVSRPTIVHGHPCSIAEVYKAIGDSPEEIAGLNTILYELGYDQPTVYAELVEEGYAPAFTAINKHRGGRCRCFTLDRTCCKTCKRNLSHCVCEG